MNQQENKLNFGTLKTVAHHRYQLEQKLDRIRKELAGRDQPLLPEDWDDEDALQLARALSSLMARVHCLNQTVFNSENPYPSNDAPLEEIRYYNPFGQADNPFVPPDLPLGLWTHVLHGGILMAAGNPSFCFPSSGTFDDLERLFFDVIRTETGPIPQFDSVLGQLEAALAGGRYDALKAYAFGPEPPRFKPPKNSEEEDSQKSIHIAWMEWDWLNRFPCLQELSTEITHLNRSELRGQVQRFVHQYIGMEGLLRKAIDLYLYQNGVSSMLEDRYFATYALLSRAQKQLQAVKEG